MNFYFYDLVKSKVCKIVIKQNLKVANLKALVKNKRKNKKIERKTRFF